MYLLNYLPAHNERVAWIAAGLGDKSDQLSVINQRELLRSSKGQGLRPFALACHWGDGKAARVVELAKNREAVSDVFVMARLEEHLQVFKRISDTETTKNLVQYQGDDHKILPWEPQAACDMLESNPAFTRFYLLFEFVDNAEKSVHYLRWYTSFELRPAAMQATG